MHTNRLKEKSNVTFKSRKKSINNLVLALLSVFVFASFHSSAQKVGDSLQVFWSNAWYSTIVKEAKDGKWLIHYKGYDNNYDEWVGPDRIPPVDNDKEDATANRPVVGAVGKAYKGDEGLVVTIVRIGDESKNRVLLKFSGIDHPWNGKVFKAAVLKPQISNHYIILENGKCKMENGVPVSVIIGSPNGYDGNYLDYKVFIPNGPSGKYIAYDETESKKIVPNDILTEYLKQKGKK